MKIHEKYISRCIQLGKNGLGIAAPNPMVGAVIVYNNTVIGEGFTSRFGGPHAEVNAIRSVTDHTLLSDATLYVTLEPCSHQGKTPPCADLIIENRIPRVVIGITDPNKKVSGQGIQKLLAAGCDVITPVLEKECREHHKRFLTFHEQKRPYIILKWAETQDGFIAPEKNIRKGNPEPYWITNRYSKQKVHQWRSEEQAILVGTNTVLEDNPKLTTRLWKGHSPLRIVIDQNARIPKKYHMLDAKTPTLLITKAAKNGKQVEGVDYEFIDFSDNIVPQICEVLYKYHVQSILVEGGAKTLNAFIDCNLWDEARIFTGPDNFFEGLKSPRIKGKEYKRLSIGKDLLKIIRND